MSRKPTPGQVSAALEFYEKLAAPPAPELELVEGGGCAPPIVATVDPKDEAHRHACEVRYVRDMTPARRAEFLRGVADKRGEQAAERIRREL